ncbi:MAG: hypothetical protein ACK4TP_17420 [Hyphomicrobium sp.]
MPTISYPNDQLTLAAVIGGLSEALGEALKEFAEAKGQSALEALRERCLLLVKGTTSESVLLTAENAAVGHALAAVNAVFDRIELAD